MAQSRKDRRNSARRGSARRAAKGNAAGNQPVSREQFAGQANASGSEYSRNSTARYTKARRKRGLGKGVKIFLGVLIAVLVIGCGAAWALMSRFSSSFGMASDTALHNTLSEAASGDPFYMVLIGVDKDSYREESSEYGSAQSSYRTDSILLARVDPTEKQVTLVSIHRDTLTDFGEYGKQKINAAYSIGWERNAAGETDVSGASYTVETISKFAGVPISHYAEVDLEQFISVVDTIGGITVNVPVDCIDPEYTGANIKAGEQTLDGDNALKLCRARHAYDSYGDGDVYRAANQRMVIGAIMKKILASDVATIASTVTTLADAVSTDLSVTDIVSLCTQFQGFDMSTDMFSGMEPTDSKYVNNTWYEICDVDAWQKMMTRVNQGLSPYESEDEDTTLGIAGSGTAVKNEDGTTAASSDSSSSDSSSDSSSSDYSGTVEVLNGAGVQGLAARVASTLSDSGFTTSADTADSYDYTTTQIIYVGSENQSKAQAVADKLGLSNVVADDGTYSGQADVVVVLGADMSNS